MSYLIIVTILLQLSVLLWVRQASLPGLNRGRLLALIWAALTLTVVVCIIYVLALLHLPRLSPGLLLFWAGLLGAGLQLAALATHSYNTRQIRLGAYTVMVSLVLFYFLNTVV
ncbi:hypothetical protein [Deinococcus sp.]|uniref:hypothetical protein n=1 Tax=Deinococcus sp. TaxID=47478 RepID=UPI003B5A8687